jgi:thiol-disulfide isomerase/thioredoxin
MRRTIATTAAVAAAALVLSACGTGDDNTSAAGSATTEAAETAPATPEPTTAVEPTETPADNAEADGEEAPEEIAVPAALDFDAPTVDGGTFNGATLVGQDSVLYFWAPWCTVCRAEAPSLPGVASEFDGQATFYGVAGLSPDVAAMQGFVADTGTGELTHIADTEGSVYTGFGVSSQTTFAFVNDDGTIEIVRGPLTEDDLRARTQALIDS